MKKLLLLSLLSFTSHAMDQEVKEVSIVVSSGQQKHKQVQGAVRTQENKAEKIELSDQQKRFLENVLHHGFFDKPKYFTIPQFLVWMLGTSAGLGVPLEVKTTHRDPSVMDVGLTMVGLAAMIGIPLLYRWRSNRELQYRKEYIQEGMDCLGAKAIAIKSLIEKVMSQDFKEHQNSGRCGLCAFIANREMLGSHDYSSQEGQEALKERRKQCKECKMSYFQRELGLREPFFPAYRL